MSWKLCTTRFNPCHRHQHRSSHVIYVDDDVYMCLWRACMAVSTARYHTGTSTSATKIDILVHHSSRQRTVLCVVLSRPLFSSVVVPFCRPPHFLCRLRSTSTSTPTRHRHPVTAIHIHDTTQHDTTQHDSRTTTHITQTTQESEREREREKHAQEI